jgi:hypothetical protein
MQVFTKFSLIFLKVGKTRPLCSVECSSLIFLDTKYILLLTTEFTNTILRKLKEIPWILRMMSLEIFPSHPVVLFLSISRPAYVNQLKKFLIANGLMIGGELGTYAGGERRKAGGRCGKGLSIGFLFWASL